MTRKVADPGDNPATAPQDRAATGHALDAWGLPVGGPARAAVLAEMGLPDPNIDPAPWKRAQTPKTTAPIDKVEKSNG